VFLVDFCPSQTFALSIEYQRELGLSFILVYIRPDTMTDVAQVVRNPKIVFSLSSVILQQDIKQLATIHVEALKDDASAAVKFADQDDFRIKIEHMLEGQVHIGDDSKNSEPLIRSALSSSNVNDWFIVKATMKSSDNDNKPEKIIGWASWLHENPSPSEEGKIQLSVDKQQDVREDNRKLLQFNQGLGALVRQHQSHLYEEWSRKRWGEREGSATNGLLSLRSCFILPEFQRHGVGTALVRYGCERADALMLDTLVTSTQMAKPLYELAGNFEAFDYLEVDLNKFDCKREIQSNRSQETPRYYRFWFMARLYQQTAELTSRSVQ
jgi:hypothetical protein